MITINNILDTIKYIDDIKVVIFDLDDTLYNEIDYMISGFKEVIVYLKNKYSIKIDNKVYAKKMVEYYNSGEKPIDKLLYECNIHSIENVYNCIDIYRKHIPDLKLNVDVKCMLEKIKKANRFLGIITDGRPEGQRAKIKVLELEKYIDHIIITDELGGIEFRKPNKTSYDMMKEYFCVDYNEMCYVGDNIKKDLIYPEKIGMKSILYSNKKGINNEKRSAYYNCF